MIKISRKKIEGLTKKAMAGTRKSPVRIESCIRIRVHDDIITVYAINDRFSVTVWDHLEFGAEDFDCILDAKIFFDFVSKMTSDEIILEKKQNMLRLKDERIKLDIPILSSDLWPDHKKMGQNVFSFALGKKESKAINGCTHALKKDGAGNVLMAAIHLEVAENYISTTALDGYRISHRWFGDINSDLKKYNINGEILIKALSLIENDEDKNFSTDGEYFAITSSNAKITGSIESNPYFNMDVIYATLGDCINVSVNRQELLDALNIASLIKPEIDLNVYEDHIVISAQSSIAAKSVINIPAKVSGKDLEITFRGKYVIDSLKSITDDMIEIKFSSAMKPIHIVGENYEEIILPIRKR